MKISKNAERWTNSKHSHSTLTPTVVTQKINGVDLIGEHVFCQGNHVPIFKVNNFYALNQLLGYAKFLNTKYGNVYYRGECKIHDSMTPSMYHGIKSKVNSKKTNLNKLINNIYSNQKMINFMNISNAKKNIANLVIESMLQHYGVATHFLDVVDNHWVALWFGLNERKTFGKNSDIYYRYDKRQLNAFDCIEYHESDKYNPENLYQYLILIAADNNMASVYKGVCIGHDVITIDLRTSLPSTFLRPHAQHGLVLKKNQHSINENYDLSNNVVSILKIRCDLVEKWIGNGTLLSTSNLFPEPAFDLGFNVLNHNSSLFEETNCFIDKYLY